MFALFVLGTILAIVAFAVVMSNIPTLNDLKGFKAQQIDTNNNDFDARLKKLEEIKLNSGAAGSALARGPQGVRGPAGPQGPAGGFYTASGPLINMSNKKVATPTSGKGGPSIVYLDDKHYSPIQYWFLENNTDGTVKVRNKFTDYCLTVNNLGDVFSDVCDKTNPNQNFNWQRNMQLSTPSFANQCVAISDFTRSNYENNNYNYESLKAENKQATGVAQKLKLEACSASLNPKQTWYVGQ